MNKKFKISLTSIEQQQLAWKNDMVNFSILKQLNVFSSVKKKMYIGFYFQFDTEQKLH